MHINVSSIGFKGKDEIVRRGFRDLPENYYPHTNLKYEKKISILTHSKLVPSFIVKRNPPTQALKELEF